MEGLHVKKRKKKNKMVSPFKMIFSNSLFIKIIVSNNVKLIERHEVRKNYDWISESVGYYFIYLDDE